MKKVLKWFLWFWMALIVITFVASLIFEVPEEVSPEVKERTAVAMTEWYKIDEFPPPLLDFVNGCWGNDSDTIIIDWESGDFYFNSRDNLKMEVMFDDFDAIGAYYNGNRMWGGPWYRNKNGDKIKVNHFDGTPRIYSKVDCP